MYSPTTLPALREARTAALYPLTFFVSRFVNLVVAVDLLWIFISVSLRWLLY